MATGHWLYVLREGHVRYEAGTIGYVVQGDDSESPPLGRDEINPNYGRAATFVFVEGLTDRQARDMTGAIWKLDPASLKAARPDIAGKIDAAMDKAQASDHVKTRPGDPKDGQPTVKYLMKAANTVSLQAADALAAKRGALVPPGEAVGQTIDFGP